MVAMVGNRALDDPGAHAECERGARNIDERAIRDPSLVQQILEHEAQLTQGGSVHGLIRDAVGAGRAAPSSCLV